MASYFTRESESSYVPSNHVAGSWNTSEQHIAPPMGLLAHVLEVDHASRGGKLQLISINYDILGVLPIEAVEVSTRVLRPGRTIELLEGTLSHNGRPALIARAWFLAEGDTEQFAGSSLTPIPPRSEMQPWAPSQKWPGDFIASIEAFQIEESPGRAQSWARTVYPILDREPTSLTARMLGIVDLANGTTPRVSTNKVIFPNLDLKVNIVRPPVNEWIGFDTAVTFGDNGFGLTQTIIHDDNGPIGSLAQSLTVRTVS
ncbi:MAG TPA: thioesterase family protein [Microbacteriaceae bacterium]|nr:thioesterase family protein [Microbacteriaceae bacterium]